MGERTVRLNVPIRFERFLAWREPGPGRPGIERCDCCGEREATSPDGRCRECLRYEHGYDQAQEQVAKSILAGAVNAALDAEVGEEMIRAAVDEAIAAHHFEEGRSWGCLEQKHCGRRDRG